MKTFMLRRDKDATGVSGTGWIAEGVEFTDGTCVLRWLTEYASTALYESIEVLMKIHGHGGRTVLVWGDVL
jgi:hypothetical protein